MALSITKYQEGFYEKIKALPLLDEPGYYPGNHGVDRGEYLFAHAERIHYYPDWEELEEGVWKNPHIMWRDNTKGGYWHYEPVIKDPETIPHGVVPTGVQGVWAMPDNQKYFSEEDY